MQSDNLRSIAEAQTRQEMTQEIEERVQAKMKELESDPNIVNAPESAGIGNADISSEEYIRQAHAPAQEEEAETPSGENQPDRSQQ